MSCYENTAAPGKRGAIFERCCSWPDKSWSCRHPVRQSWACTTPLVFPAGLALPSAPQWCDITYPLVILVSAALASLSSKVRFQRGRMGWGWGILSAHLQTCQSLHIRQSSPAQIIFPYSCFVGLFACFSLSSLIWKNPKTKTKTQKNTPKTKPITKTKPPQKTKESIPLKFISLEGVKHR